MSETINTANAPRTAGDCRCHYETEGSRNGLALWVRCRLHDSPVIPLPGNSSKET